MQHAITIAVLLVSVACSASHAPPAPDASTVDAGSMSDAGNDPGLCGDPLTGGWWHRCEGACFDTRVTRRHCGSCGVECPAGEYCGRGECKPWPDGGDPWEP